MSSVTSFSLTSSSRPANPAGMGKPAFLEALLALGLLSSFSSAFSPSGSSEAKGSLPANGEVAASLLACPRPAGTIASKELGLTDAGAAVGNSWRVSGRSLSNAGFLSTTRVARAGTTAAGTTAGTTTERLTGAISLLRI